MSGGVRDRIERAQRLEIENKLDAVGPKPMKTTLAGNTPTASASLRERVEAAAFVDTDDPVIRNPEYRHGGRTTVVQYNPSSVRQRLK